MSKTIRIFEVSPSRLIRQETMFDGQAIDLEYNRFVSVEPSVQYNEEKSILRRNEIGYFFEKLQKTGLFNIDEEKECFTLVKTDSEYLTEWKKGIADKISCVLSPDTKGYYFYQVKNDFYNVIDVYATFDGEYIHRGTEFLSEIIRAGVGTTFYVGGIVSVVI